MAPSAFCPHSLHQRATRPDPGRKANVGQPQQAQGEGYGREAAQGQAYCFMHEVHPALNDCMYGG